MALSERRERVVVPGSDSRFAREREKERERERVVVVVVVITQG